MSIPVFVAPEFKQILKRRVQIPFTGIIGIGANLTLVSSRITFPFVVTSVEMIFRDDAANLLRYYVLVSQNQNVSTTGVPPDPNVFSQYSPSPYFVGEGTIKKAECAVQAPEGYQYVKVHTVNGNAYAQTINVTVTIEEM